MIEMNIGIIGGSDGLGKTLCYYLRDEFNVYISGRDHQKGRNVADMLNINYIESNTELAQISDVLIVSVPIHHTSGVIREVAQSMKEGALMVDVTSVKEEPSKTMEEALPETVEYIPTHPIFGPRTTSLDNQVIVLTPTKKGKWYDKVYNYLDGKHMRIIETTAEKHDYMMSIVQVLTHFSFISTASAIEKLQVDISETEDYESPIYNLMIDMIARIVAQNPYLTYYIQSMNTAVNVGAIFRSAAALGIDGVLLTSDCCDPLNRRSLRVSMGTVLQIPWAYMEVNPRKRNYPKELNALGFKTAAMALSDNSVSIDDSSLKSEEKLAIILGSEGYGLPENTISACDVTVKIPMFYGVDSLNVAAASAVAFWELRNARKQD